MVQIRLDFINDLNERFEELHFGYRIVSELVTGITSPADLPPIFR